MSKTKKPIVKQDLPKLPSKEVMAEYRDLKLGLSDEDLLRLWFMGYMPLDIRAMRQHPSHLLAYDGWSSMWNKG